MSDLVFDELLQGRSASKESFVKIEEDSRNHKPSYIMLF